MLLQQDYIIIILQDGCIELRMSRRRAATYQAAYDGRMYINNKLQRSLLFFVSLIKKEKLRFLNYIIRQYTIFYYFKMRV